MKSWVLAIILAVIALAPVFCLTYYYRSEGPPKSEYIASVDFEPVRVEKKLEAGTEFDIRAVKIIDGYRFDLYLEGGKRIEAHLVSATKDEATVFVVEWLNKATPPPPTVTLRRQVGNYWIVDFHLTVDGKRSSMVELLRSKGLLL